MKRILSVMGDNFGWKRQSKPASRLIVDYVCICCGKLGAAVRFSDCQKTCRGMQPQEAAVFAAVCALVLLGCCVLCLLLSKTFPSTGLNLTVDKVFLYELPVCREKALKAVGARSECEPAMPLKKPAACTKKMVKPKKVEAKRGAKAASKGSRCFSNVP